MWPETDVRSSSPLRVHLPATPSDAIGVKTIPNIKHRIFNNRTSARFIAREPVFPRNIFAWQIEPTLAVDRRWTFSVHKWPVI
jgi:hypothetical protein